MAEETEERRVRKIEYSLSVYSDVSISSRNRTPVRIRIIEGGCSMSAVQIREILESLQAFYG